MTGPTPIPVTRSDFDDAGLTGWTWVDEPAPSIVAGFRAADYTGAAAFALEVARQADDAVHHPDIDIRYQRHCRVTLTTHETAGVSDLDLSLAAAINARADALGVDHDADTPR